MTLTSALFIQKYLPSTSYVSGTGLAVGIYSCEQVREDSTLLVVNILMERQLKKNRRKEVISERSVMKAASNTGRCDLERLGTGVASPVGMCLGYTWRIVGKSKKSP